MKKKWPWLVLSVVVAYGLYIADGYERRSLTDRILDEAERLGPSIKFENSP